MKSLFDKFFRYGMLITILPLVILSIYFTISSFLKGNTPKEEIGSVGDIMNNLFPVMIALVVVGILAFSFRLIFNVEKREEENYIYDFLEFPKELRTPLQQYLTFFKEYVETSKGKEISFDIEQTKNGLRIRTKEEDNISIKEIRAWFNEYITFIKTDKNKRSINVERKDEKENPKEIDLLIVKLENQVNNLENSLKIAHLENHYLKEDNVFLKRLALAFGNKDNVIHNQYIQGGSQQFANQIDNQKSKK